VQGYLLCKSAEGVRQRTLDSYRYHLELAIGFFGDECDVASLTTGDIVRFLDWLRNDYKPTRAFQESDEPLSEKSRHNVYISLSGFWTWLEIELELPHIVRRIRAPRFTDPAIVPFSREDIVSLIEACARTAAWRARSGEDIQSARSTGTRDRAVLLLLLDTGMRASELCGLNIQDVALETGQVRVVERHGAPGPKGGAERYVVIGKSARRALWLYLAERPDSEIAGAPVFVTQAGRRFSRDTLRQMVHRLGERAGVKDCHPHRFRHTFAINYLRNGGDIFTLQLALGHKSLKMVKRYLALAQVDMEEAHRRASPVDRWAL
jgi:integrase/recombinase XerD